MPLPAAEIPRHAPGTSPRQLSKTFPVSAATAIALLLPLVVNVLIGWCYRVPADQPWDHVGPPLLAIHVRSAVQGLPIYRDFRVPPYGPPNPYGPVVPYLAAPLMKFFPASPIAPLEAGRVLTLAATTSVSILLGTLGWRCGTGVGAATLASLAFFLSPLLEPWAYEFRVDLPALAFDFGALVSFQFGLAPMTLALLVVSFFIKQMRFAAIAAIVLYCWLNGNRKQAFILAASYLVAIFLIAAIIQQLCPYYWLNNYAVLMPLYDFGAPREMLAHLFDKALPIFALAAVGVLTTGPRRSLSVCFLLAAFVQDTAASTRWGSNDYYFLPTFAAAAAVASLRLDDFLRGWRGLPIGLQLIPGIVIAALVLSPSPSGWLGYDQLIDSRLLSAAQSREEAKSSAWDPAALLRLRQIHGPVLTDVQWLGLTNPSNDIWLPDWMPLSTMRMAGTFDDTALIAAIKNHKIAAIALDGALLERSYRGRPWFWPEIREAITDNYYLLPSLGPPFIALPRSDTKH